MSKKKLDLTFEVEAEVLGLVTSLKDYKLAWKINQVFKIELILEDDLVIDLTEGGSATLSNYCYQTEFYKMQLVKNKAIGKEKLSYLAKELPQIDYFLLIEDGNHFMEISDLITSLKSIGAISYVQLIDTTKLKYKDNFIFN